MSLSDILEDFSVHPTSTPVVLSDVMFEEQKLDAFEKGYKAGWEDCAEAQKSSETRVAEDFASNIRDLAFTYEDAQAAILGAMEPVVRQMVDTVLPGIAHDTLGVRISELLQSELSRHGRQPVQIETAPGNAVALRAILPQDSALDLEVKETDTLGEGQVRIRFGQSSEQEIDLSHVLEGIRTASEAFFQQATTLKETA